MPEQPNANTQQNQQQPDQAQQPDISALVNQAVTSQLKRIDFGKIVGDHVERVFASRQEQVQSKAPDATGQGAAGAQGAPHPDVARLTAELTKLKEQSERAEKRRLEVEQQARTDKAHADIRSRLQAAGVRSELLDAAHVLLTTRALRFDKDTGEAVLSIKRSRAAGANPEAADFDLESGVKDWLASTEAKPFLPAPTKPNTPQPGPARRPGDPPPRQPRTQDEMLDAAVDRLGPEGLATLQRAFTGQ